MLLNRTSIEEFLRGIQSNTVKLRNGPALAFLCPKFRQKMWLFYWNQTELRHKTNEHKKMTWKIP